MSKETVTTPIAVGDRVKVPKWPETYTVTEINTLDPNEPIALFKEGGFWRCSQLEVVHAA